MAEGFTTIQDNDAAGEIRDGYTVYGEDTLDTKFPSLVDGLKNSTRRIVWFTRDDKNETKGMNKIIGDIGDVHTAGDGSIYGAIIRLAQSFMVNQPLIYVPGNSGEYSDPTKAAAPRYLKAKVSDFFKDVYINGVSTKALPMMPTKDFMGYEPRHLIPRIPMALILGNLTVGLGFKSSVPMYSLTSVCDLVISFSEIMKKTDMTITPEVQTLSKYLRPCFPIRNLVTNDAEIKESYAKGNFKCPILLEGYVELTGSSITLRYVPYGDHFCTVVEKVCDRLVNPKDPINNYVMTAHQYSSGEAEFCLPLKRNVNPFEALDYLRPLLTLNDTYSPHLSFVKDGRVVEIDPLLLTFYWYRERYNNIASGLRNRQSDDLLQLDFQRALLIVADRADEVVSILRSSDNADEAVIRLSTAFPDLTRHQARRICQAPMERLAKNSKDAALKEIDRLEADLKRINVEFGKIHEAIQNDARYIKRKYPETVLTQYSSEFKGYVQFGKWGIIHFFDENDMYGILASKWPSSIKKTIHLYDKGSKDRYIVKGNRLIPMTNPRRQISCEGVVCYSGNDAGYTLALGSDGRTCVVARNVREVHSDYSLLPISKQFYAIHRNGKITLDDVGDYSQRKTVSAGARTDLIYALPKRCSNIVVFHMNPTQESEIRVDLILSGKDDYGHLITSPRGEVNIIGVYPLKSKEIYLNIPDCCRKGLSVEHLQVLNLNEVLGDKTRTCTLNLNKRSGLSKYLKRNSTVGTLYTLDLRAANKK